MPARRALILSLFFALAAGLIGAFSPSLRLLGYRIPQAIGHAEARYWALYRMGEEGAAGIDLIARSLDDENEVVRRAAFEILVELSDEHEPAWSALLSLSRGGPIDLRLRLFRWLEAEDRGRPGALKAWSRGLGDPDPEVAELAAQGLRALGLAAWPILEQSLASPEPRSQERACRLIITILDAGSGGAPSLARLTRRLQALRASNNTAVAAAARDALISVRSRR